MEPDKTLEGILELLDTKSTMRDFVEAFGVAIDHISEMKAENEQEREALKAQVSDSVDKAIQRITTGSQQEWTKIRTQVALLRDGKDGKDGREGRDGRDGIDGRDGTDGKDGKDGANGTIDTPDEIIEKINQSSLLISRERIEGLADAIRNMVANASVSVTTSFFNGLRAKNLTINGATATQRGDTVFITVPSSAASGTYVRDENVAASGSGTAFTLSHTPIENTLQLFRGGTRITTITPNADYSIAGTAITLGFTLQSGETLTGDYQY